MTDDGRTRTAALARRAATDPGAVALAVAGGDRLTDGEWERRGGAVAQGLRARGVGPGDRVVLVFDLAGWLEYAVAYVAVLRAGAVAVPLPASLDDGAVERVAAACGAVGALVGGGHRRRLGRTWVADETELAAAGVGTEPGAVDDPGAVAEVRVAVPLLGPPVIRDVTHGEVAAEAATAFPAGCRPPRSVLHACPLGSPVGQLALGLALAPEPLLVLAFPGFDPDGFAAAAARHRVEALAPSPALAAALVDGAVVAGHDLSSVRHLLMPAGRPAARLADALSATVVPVPAVPVPAPEADAAPVAFSQEGMLWHEQLVPGCQNLPALARRLRGPLDVGALERALGEIVRRHEPLRTGFEIRHGRPVQVVRPATPFALPVRDVTHLGPEDQALELDRTLAEQGRRPFDLAAEPLFAPTLLRLGDADHVLVLRVHHSVYDDWSVGVFRRELAALYAAYRAGVPSPLPEPPVRFSQFARRQRQRLEGAAGEAELAYWRRELGGAPFGAQLRIGDPSRPAGAPLPAPDPVSLVVPPDLHRRLRELAGRLRATPFMVVLAAFQVLVHRDAGRDDVLIASVVANRNRVELEGLIGCFTKKVPLRLRLGAGATFATVVADARRALLGALAHQDLPFETVLGETVARPAAAHGLVPHVDVMVQGVTPRDEGLALAGLSTTGLETSATTRRAHFTARPEGGPPPTPWGGGLYLGTFLILSVAETADGLSLHARGAFHPPAVERLLARFGTLLEDAVSRPDAPAAALDSGPSDPPAPAAGTVDLGGFAVDPARIEAALVTSPAVAAVAVVARDGPDGRRLVAYVEPAGRVPTLAELRLLVWRHLPGYAWPAAVVAVDSLDRRPPPPEDDPTAPAPATVEEVALATAWADGRGPDSYYWQDFSFLEAAAALEAVGFPVPSEEVARHRTVRALAVALAAARQR